MTPLHVYSEQGRIDGLRELIRAGANVNAAIPLIRAGANVNAAIPADLHNDVRGWTPLHFAAVNGWRRAVILLLRAGADVAAESAVRVYMGV
jgi:ankyrin repeat protein